MSLFLGVDTSNYTTSAALYDPGSGSMRQERRPLRVRPGQKGLRQSEAVYQHIRSLPEVLGRLFEPVAEDVAAVGVSDRPRPPADSFMPCFEAGVSAACSIAAAARIPVIGFSHQAGHIAAALFSVGRLDWLDGRFVAFHVSGGTTEAVLCSPGEGPGPCIEPVLRSLDLKAGQAIDRVGLALGLSFPAGPALERLALQSRHVYEVRPSMREGNCCLSGVENRCLRLLHEGAARCDVARYCLDSVRAALDGMTRAVRARRPGVPLLYAGGVMTDSILRMHFESRYGAQVARPGFSADNACGIAVLAALSRGEKSRAAG